MRLLIATPLSTVVDEADVAHVRAEDASGSFGIRPGHADFLTALEVSVISWRDAAQQLHHAAVRGGALSVTGGSLVRVATPEAVVGAELRQLETAVLSRFRQQAIAEHSSNIEARRMNIAAVRTLVRLLRPGARMSGPGTLDGGGFGS